MSLIQQQEDADYAASAGHDRFDGFDRGDLDWDYEAEQCARNEADEQALRVLRCPACGYQGPGFIPQHADPATGLTCKELTRYA